MNTKEKELIERFEAFYKSRIKGGGFEYPAGHDIQMMGKFFIQEIRTAVANTEKQVMEKYNSIGRVVEESSKMQLDKWEEAIRKEAIAEREKEIENLINKDTEYPQRIWSKSLETVELDIAMDGLRSYKRDLLQALKGQKEGQE